jgi:hypothetical protein
VNGVLIKNDDYFRDSNFKPAEIGWTGIYIGKCPTKPQDFEDLKNIGIEAILNLMNANDIPPNCLETQEKEFNETYLYTIDKYRSKAR